MMHQNLFSSNGKIWALRKSYDVGYKFRAKRLFSNGNELLQVRINYLSGNLSSC